MMNPSNFDQSNLIGSLSIAFTFLTIAFLCLFCLKTKREHSLTVSSTESFQQVFFTNLSFNHGSSTMNQLADIQRWSSIDSPELTFYRLVITNRSLIFILSIHSYFSLALSSLFNITRRILNLILSKIFIHRLNNRKN